MYVQLDRFEDGRWAVLVPYPEGGKTFDVPSRTLPEGASPGDVFRMDFELDAVRTERASSGSESLMDELLGRSHNDDSD